LQPLNEDPGVSAKRLSALAALFLSLRRHDPDQVRRVAAHPAASQPPVGAPLGRGDYPQSAALPSRLQAPGHHFGKTAVFEPDQHPSEGKMLTTGIPVCFSATPGKSFRLPPPRLGKHTRQVLAGLGYSETPTSSR
jgi:hypothetical protein